MQVKFSEDVVPLSDLKINPGKVVGRAQDAHRPILLTSQVRGSSNYQQTKHKYLIRYSVHVSAIIILRVWYELEGER
jgi:hypothetical protein